MKQYLQKLFALTLRDTNWKPKTHESQYDLRPSYTITTLNLKQPFVLPITADRKAVEIYIG